jgi:uncharacterized membrane protein YhhN
METGGLFRTFLKALPVSTLLVMVLRYTWGFPRACLAGALFGSVCGDVLLDMQSPSFFIYGLFAFLVGHLFYIVLFFRYAKRPDRNGRWTIAGLAVLACVMVWIFHGIPPALFAPVLSYIAVIITMSVGALLVPAESRFLFWGALLFIASDIVLAVNKFLFPIPYGRVMNIGLYFIAQWTIITAAMTLWRARKRS